LSSWACSTASKRLMVCVSRNFTSPIVNPCTLTPFTSGGA
jgi:hypothetical protein